MRKLLVVGAMGLALFATVAVTNQWAGTAADENEPQRLFSNVVNVGSAAFLFQDQFKAYIDAISANGIGTLRVYGAWREFCHQCAPQEIDFNTEPSLGTYDFSQYFQRLDYVVGQKGMRVVLTFSLAGLLDSDPLFGGARQVFRSFIG